MTAIVTSPEDVINLALDRIGYSQRIANIMEGTPAANAALNIYSQTRDALLRAGDWGFAQITIAAVLSGQTAPVPWAISYQYPADCLKVRNLFQAAYTSDPSDPLPVLYEIAFNSVAGRVILTNEAGAFLVYTAQQADPSKWEPLFIEALAVELAKRLALTLASVDAEKVALEDEKSAVPLAAGVVG